MKMKDSDPGPDAAKLESTFYSGDNSRFLDQFRRRTDTEARREDLRQVVRIKDEAFLDRLTACDIGAETAVALRIVPLVFVAWADGKLDERKREALMKAAGEEGLAADGTARQMLNEWLTHRPGPALLAAWKQRVSRLWNRFTPDERLKMRRNLLSSAREVAESSGGILGLGSKISARERDMLDELGKVLD